MEPKEKRQLSPEHLEKLKIARERALAVRQKKAGEKKLVKELETKEHEQKIENIKERLEDIKKPKKKVVAPVPEPESEPESEPEVIVKKKTKKKAKKIIVVEDSDTDEEQQQVIYVKRKKDPPSSAPIPIPQAPQLIQQEPPGLPRKQFIDPSQLYQEHYQRNGFPRRY